MTRSIRIRKATPALSTHSWGGSGHGSNNGGSGHGSNNGGSGHGSNGGGDW